MLSIHTTAGKGTLKVELIRESDGQFWRANTSAFAPLPVSNANWLAGLIEFTEVQATSEGSGNGRYVPTSGGDIPDTAGQVILTAYESDVASPEDLPVAQRRVVLDGSGEEVEPGSLNMGTEVPLDAEPGTLGYCLNAASVQAFGNWSLNSITKVLTLYNHDGSVAHQFEIDSLLNPLSRTTVE